MVPLIDFQKYVMLLYERITHVEHHNALNVIRCYFLKPSAQFPVCRRNEKHAAAPRFTYLRFYFHQDGEPHFT